MPSKDYAAQCNATPNPGHRQIDAALVLHQTDNCVSGLWSTGHTAYPGGFTAARICAIRSPANMPRSPPRAAASPQAA